MDRRLIVVLDSVRVSVFVVMFLMIWFFVCRCCI